jgi:hypothetical protein
MGEPSLPTRAALLKFPPDTLTTLVNHQFPSSIIEEVDGKFILLTVHAVGATEREARENALATYREMKEDGESLPQMLEDVALDLKSAGGMTRARHDSLLDLLTICETSLNGGVLTKSVPWLMVGSYTRQIEDLRRRVITRLGMTAQEIAANEKAKSHASAPHTPPRRDEAGRVIAMTYTELRAKSAAKRAALRDQ